MQQKLLVELLLGVSALILYSHLNWNGVYCKDEMANPIRSVAISNSGLGSEIGIEIINSKIPPELNTAVSSIERAVCIQMTKGHPTIIADRNFPVTVIKITEKNEQSESDITHHWTHIETHFYICTSPQVAHFLFHRVEQIHLGSTLRVSKATLFDERLQAERVLIESGENTGKSTAKIKVVTHRNYNDWKTERKYSGFVKIVEL